MPETGSRSVVNCGETANLDQELGTGASRVGNDGDPSFGRTVAVLKALANYRFKITVDEF